MPTPSHILVVEDDPQVASLLGVWLLQDWPVTTMIQHVSTLADAIKALQTQPVDMLLVDLTLPNGQGLAVIDALMDAMPPDKPPLPNVVVTGEDKADLDALRHGVGEWVSKADGTTLRQRLKTAMEHEWARYRYRQHFVERLKGADTHE